MSATTAGAPPGSRYADQRPYAVADSIDHLRGPTSGTVVLGRRLDWSGRARYDLANPRRLASMYETVLREATNPDDLARWLDGPTLIRMWPQLVLPPRSANCGRRVSPAGRRPTACGVVEAGTPPIHRRLAQIGLRGGGPYGFALAGGHAIAAHGILQRPSVDLFADWQRRADFPTAVGEVIAAYRSEGLDVQVDLRLDTFARLHVTDPDLPDRQHRVELVANWRAQLPVQMDVGPVPHPDDVMAGKMDALYNRAAARDFLDIDAAITSGRYTLDYLCDLAHDADAGFDRHLFAAMLGRIGRLDDEDFTEYGASPKHVAALRQRVHEWHTSLALD